LCADLLAGEEERAHKFARMFILYAILEWVIYYYELTFGALGGNQEKALLAHTTTQGCEICALGFLFSREHPGSDLMKTFGA
jgi:hypothetical protein